MATRHFPEGDRVFDGHFPGHPILPGVLGVESLAQAAGALVNLSRGIKAHECVFYFTGLEKVKFRKPVLPNDTLTLEVKQLQRLRDVFYKFEGVGTVNGEKCFEATFSAKHVIQPSA